MIRKAGINDLKEMQALNKLLFEKEKQDYDELLNTNWPFEKEGGEYFKKVINDRDKFAFVADEDKKIVGYLAGTIKKQPIYKGHCLEAEIDNTLVLDEYRGKGIGTKLMKAFIGWVKDSGAKRIEVRASSQNKRGLNFYKKNGFEDFDVVLKLDL